jgi:hypothetical protein
VTRQNGRQQIARGAADIDHLLGRGVRMLAQVLEKGMP